MPLTEIDKAYLAGIIDGEGSICLAKSHSHRSNGLVYPTVRVASTDSRLIEWISNKVGTGAIHYTNAMNERCKSCHHIGWASNQAIAVLEMVRPYLIIKAEQADVVLDMWRVSAEAKREAGGYFGNGHPVPDWLKDYRDDAFIAVQALNKRGVNRAVNS